METPLTCGDPFLDSGVVVQEEKDITAEDVDLLHQQLLDAIQVSSHTK